MVNLNFSTVSGNMCPSSGDIFLTLADIDISKNMNFLLNHPVYIYINIYIYTSSLRKYMAPALTRRHITAKESYELQPSACQIYGE